jgi:hypothetical protein
MLGHRKLMLAAIRELRGGTPAPEPAGEAPPQEAAEAAEDAPAAQPEEIPVAAKEPAAAPAPVPLAAPAPVPAAHIPAPAVGAVPVPKPTIWKRIFNQKFLFISIVAHLVFGLIATAFVVQSVVQRKLTFTAAPPSPSPGQRAAEHRVQMAQKRKTMSMPTQSKRITTTGISKVALPDMPSMPGMVAPTKLSGMAGSVSFGQGMGGGGIGGGTGKGAGGGTIPFFGFRGKQEGGLVGTFYDLKQTPDRKPTDMASPPGEQMDPDGPLSQLYMEVVRKFSKTWHSSVLRKYFQAPTKLVASQVFIPYLSAEEAPKAFDVEKECQPRRWLVHYQGTILPPRDGRFRFVGRADDILLVRCKGRNVLDASLPGRVVDPDANETEEAARSGTDPDLPLAAGRWIEMRKGEPTSIEVLVGENPGGLFGAWLMIEEKGAEKGGGGFSVFQLKEGKIPEGNVPRHAGTILFGVGASGRPSSLLPPR